MNRFALIACESPGLQSVTGSLRRTPVDTGRHAHRFYIFGADLGVADDADTGNVDQRLAGQLKQAALKVARNAVIAGGAGQARFQKLAVKADRRELKRWIIADYKCG